jgi:hypothetical protein
MFVFIDHRHEMQCFCVSLDGTNATAKEHKKSK